MEELAGLVRENGGSGVVHSSEDVANLASMELLCVAGFKWDGFGFGGTDVLACLVQMAFWGLYSFRIVLLDVASGEKWPTNEVPSLHSFEPS